MFELNDEFLGEVGLADLPEEGRLPFLQHVYATLEQRVGKVLSEGLTNEQLSQFEAFADRDSAKVDAWLAVWAPDYLDDPEFQRLQRDMGHVAGAVDLRAEYAAQLWMVVNRPNYRETVMQILAEVKSEIAANREAILRASR
ncbi:DUF5663 domain-containing protein [Gordonia phosphorivorans]|uniref:DUF5663 domain-containing protein n=1 Tax=Gordonia phosphorivorans TaxID=1056982 RepID=A0ABV6H6T5_9ACTN